MASNNFLVVRDGDPDGALRGAVLAMGNFDGVHRGHQAVIAAALDRAKTIGKPAGALTFEPHPRIFFNPTEPLFRLTDETAKMRLLASTGLDGAVVLTFNAALAALSAEEFVARILVGRFALSGAIIGFNFHFGKNRGGSPEFLAEQGRKFGFTVDWSRHSSSTVVRFPPARSVPRSLPGNSVMRPLYWDSHGSCPVK